VSSRAFDLGYVDGQSITIEYVSSDGKYETLPGLAAGLVVCKVDVIVAPAVQNVLAALRWACSFYPARCAGPPRSSAHSPP